MVVKYSSRGLVATTRGDATPPLNDLIGCCGWPLLLNASPRRLHRELALHNPECLLYWLDDWQAVEPTAQLIAWSRHRGARPYRVAVAYRMNNEVESVLRSAGAHSVLPLTCPSGSLAAAALNRLLLDAVRTADAAVADSALATTASPGVSAIDMPAEPARPP